MKKIILLSFILSFSILSSAQWIRYYDFASNRLNLGPSFAGEYAGTHITSVFEETLGSDSQTSAYSLSFETTVPLIRAGLALKIDNNLDPYMKMKNYEFILSKKLRFGKKLSLTPGVSIASRKLNVFNISIQDPITSLGIDEYKDFKASLIIRRKRLWAGATLSNLSTSEISINLEDYNGSTYYLYGGFTANFGKKELKNKIELSGIYQNALENEFGGDWHLGARFELGLFIIGAGATIGPELEYKNFQYYTIGIRNTKAELQYNYAAGASDQDIALHQIVLRMHMHRKKKSEKAIEAEKTL